MLDRVGRRSVAKLLEGHKGQGRQDRLYQPRRLPPETPMHALISVFASTSQKNRTTRCSPIFRAGGRSAFVLTAVP